MALSQIERDTLDAVRRLGPGSADGVVGVRGLQNTQGFDTSRTWTSDAILFALGILVGKGLIEVVGYSRAEVPMDVVARAALDDHVR